MEPQEVWPIQEYILPGDEVEVAGEIVLPPFLHDPHLGHRVVEFYAPWCPHCKHFKANFIAFARKTTEIAKPFNISISFHAVSCTVHKKVCQKFGIRSYPSIRIFPLGALNGTEVTYWKLHPFQMLQFLGVQAEFLSAVNVSTIAQVNSHPQAFAVKRDKRSQEEIYSDAMLSFDFAMRNSIFMSLGPLENKTSDAFYEWLDLLHEALPPQWTIHKPLSDLLDHMKESPLSEDILIKIMDQHQQPEHLHSQWSLACSHGDNLAGYTCGLWELFHIMTVGVVEWNNLVSDEWAIIEINEAADTLHDYVANFFACDVCRKNFLSAYDACAFDRCTRFAGEEPKDWKQLPLWLWETHNAVNVRLMKEQAERDRKLVTTEDEIRVQWPSRSECPECWGKDGAWDENLMYKYLRMEYWPDDRVSASFRRELHLSNAISVENEIADNAGISFLRLPLVIPIVPLTIFIFATIAHFIQKRKRYMTGRHKKFDGHYRNGVP